MDAVSAYSFGTLAWLSIQAVPLIVWPTFISSLLTADYQHANSVEQYFARSLGFSELTIGLLLVVLSGSLPLTSMVETPTDSVSPYANAVILVSMMHHGASAFLSYARFYQTGQTGYVFGCVGSGVLAAFALWCLLFAGDKGRTSRRTGADKRTSGFPFKNAEADKRKVRKEL